MSSCHSRHCRCSLANHPPGGTLVQEGWFPFPHTTNPCDKFRVPSLKSQTFLSFQIFQLVIYPAGLIPFKCPYNTKIKLFLFLPRFFFFFSQRGENSVHNEGRSSFWILSPTRNLLYTRPAKILNRDVPVL